MGTGASAICDSVVATALPIPCSSASRPGSAPLVSISVTNGSLNRDASEISRCAFLSPSGYTWYRSPSSM